MMYLKVPFKDKDIVKALGARWDGKAKQWFAPAGQEERFARWAEKSEVAISSVIADATQSVEAVSQGAGVAKPVGAPLSSLLFEVSEAVRKSSGGPRWVHAEVAACRVHPSSGHMYLELVEHDPNGREIAKANARIWAGNLKIVKRFEALTGMPVASGVKLLMLVQVDFSVQHGFGITIEDIDSSWTIGDMQRKLLEIKERLISEGVWDRNKKMVPPSDFQMVLVVAPDGAAGLGDFAADAKFLSNAGLCRFDFIPATFEGPSAQQSLLAAFDQVSLAAAAHVYDAVVVIRGGGAKTSLNWLNEYDLAKAICCSPLPVFTGIGHERDKTILDDVSCLSFDTPSKVVGSIFASIVDGAKSAAQNWASITSISSLIVQQEGAAVSGARDVVLAEAKFALKADTDFLNAQLAALRGGADLLLKSKLAEVKSLVREVVGLGPQSVLSRGYAVVYSNGALVKSASECKAGSDLKVRFGDGVAYGRFNE